jgi:hypothetical protein
VRRRWWNGGKHPPLITKGDLSGWSLHFRTKKIIDLKKKKCVTVGKREMPSPHMVVCGWENGERGWLKLVA